MTARWDAARAASRRPVRKYKPVGPVGPHVAVFKSKTGAAVNGVPMDHYHVFSLGIDVPELGISAYGPDGISKRGDGRMVCKVCGYQLCDCEPEYIPHMFRPVPAPPRPPSVGDQLLKAIESLRASARLCGRMLAGDVQLVVSQFVRVGASHAFIAPDSGIVAVCHPDDAAEVRRTLGLVGL